MSNNQDEKTPLVGGGGAAPPPPPSPKYESPFYFVQRSSSSNRGVDSSDKEITYDAIESETTGSSKNTPGTGSNSLEGSISSNRSANGTEEVLNLLPAGTTKEEFASRPVFQNLPSTGDNGGRKNKGFLSLFKKSKQSNAGPPPITSPVQRQKKLVKLRKVPVKIEPKVYFANERTFLAWMHVSVLLAGASIAIVAFADANPWSQLYGIMLLPVAICFIVYAMYMYVKRAAMLSVRHPGPYEDLVGPTVLGIMLMVSIVANFAIKLYSVSSS